MKRIYRIIGLLCCIVLLGNTAWAKNKKVVVDPSGMGDFTTIQAAINSLPDSSDKPITIYIKKGIYKEKIFIEKSNVILEGEDEENTVITQAVAREEWLCDHPNDWGCATVNVNGNDVTLQNLTIMNSYGYEIKEDRMVNCPNDTSIGHQKLIKKSGHQMALRTIKATRLKAIHCHFKSMTGDTVSPWNVSEGLFYFRDCIMEGGVDFYCPRGWAYATHCHFITHQGEATIWHDGSQFEDSKTVLRDCSFEGYDGFKLGRYHRDAQFYLLDCTFADNMADQDIYRKVVTTNIIKWGQRVYYYNCHRKSGHDFSWMADNLDKAKGSPKASDVSPKWVFGDRWPALGEK